MVKLFLDTNVVIDFLCGREGFYLPAAKLVVKGYNKEVNLCCSSLTFATASYILDKYHVGHEDVVNMLSDFMRVCEPTTVDKEIVEQSLVSDFLDFEDALQYFSAKKYGANAIITRNKKDFKPSDLPLYLPDEYLALP